MEQKSTFEFTVRLYHVDGEEVAAVQDAIVTLLGRRGLSAYLLKSREISPHSLTDKDLAMVARAKRMAEKAEKGKAKP